MEDILDRLYEELAAAVPTEELESEVLLLARRVPMPNSDLRSASSGDPSRLSSSEQFRHAISWTLRKAKALEIENGKLRKQLSKAEAQLRRIDGSSSQMAAANARLGRKLAKIREVLDKP